MKKKCYKCNTEAHLNYRGECDDCERRRKRDEDDDDRRRQQASDDMMTAAIITSIACM